MRIGRMFHRDAQTFLVHLFGRGLDDERYVVEKYRSQPNGEIEPIQAEQPKTKGRRKPRRTIVSRKAVRELRPEGDEIIVCTGVKLARSGVVFQFEKQVALRCTAAAWNGASAAYARHPSAHS